MKEFLIRFWAIFFILVLWFVFASPYFIKGKVPFPSTYQVNHFHPWSEYEKFWGPVKNGAMPDIIDQIYPWRHFTIESWKNGQIPFWNPYSFAGNPHLANYQSAVFSPFNLLFFIFPFIDAWSLLVLVQPLIASLFTYLFVRELKVSKTGSLISSIAFMFCGFLVVWMAYGTLSMAISFLPLALFAIEKFYNTKKIILLTILSLSIPLSFFSGHFQTSLYFFIFVLGFIFYKSVTSKNVRYTFYLILFTFLGFLFSLIQILPSIELYSNAVRSGIYIKGGGIPFYYLINIFSPDFFGNPVTRNDWFGYYAEWASFIGVIPLILALFAVFAKKSKHILFFLIAGIFSIILALDSPLQSFLGSLKIPVLSTSDPNRIIVLFSFSFSTMAGFGFDNLKELISKKQFKKIIIPFLIVCVILLIAWSSILVFKWMPVEKLIIAKRNLILPTILLFGTLIFVISSVKYKKLLLFAICYLLFAMSFDSLRFAQKWMPFENKDLVFANVPVIDGIRRNIGNGRIFGNVRAQVDTFYGFPGVEGYDPLYIGRYGEFIRASERGEFLEGERSVVTLSRDGKHIDRVLDLLGVSLIFHPVADTNQAWAYPVWKDTKRYSLIYKDNKDQLFRNNQAMNRAILFSKYEIIKDKQKILNRFYEDKFDFRNILILEEDPGISNNIKKKGTAQIISYTPNKIAIKVNTEKSALLFLSDNYYPGWRAYIDGKETEIFRANYTFRAIVVPMGQSKVEFIYKLF